MAHNRRMAHRLPEPDRPWLMRTYAGHSTARRSNELYKQNLAKGQTGLSIAFDLPTQTGYDADHELARGEVGKVGVPVGHRGDMRTLLDGIPLDRMNTSMTINATAAWLLALYIACAEEAGVDPAVLQGTTQNDIVKEYLSRGTYAFPPGPSLRLDRRHRRLHGRARAALEPGEHLLLPPAGGGRDAGAGDRLRAGHGDRGARRGAPARGRRADGRACSPASPSSSTRASASSRSTRSCARWRGCGTSSAARATASSDAAARRFRYGVQVNSLGLTEAQPENNVQRIVLEALAVTLGRDVRARAIQLPAWNEALGSAAAVGPAVVAAHPAGAGLRDRPARVPGHLRGLGGHGRAGGRAHGRRAGGDGARGRARRRGGGRAVHEGRARRVPPRADRAHRVGRAGARRASTASRRASRRR